MFNLGLLFTFYDDCDDDGGSVGDSDDDDAGGQVSGRVGLEQGATSSAPQGRNPRWMFTMVILLLIMTVTHRGWTNMIDQDKN